MDPGPIDGIWGPQTHSALEQAERDAGERIDAVFLAQTGGHLEGFYNEASVNVKASDNMIDAGDIRTVCELAKAKQAAEEVRAVVDERLQKLEARAAARARPRPPRRHRAR